MEAMQTIASHAGTGGPRVLLLNPPGDRPYLRDYYCSSISKSGYYWHPIDLLVLSGRLREAGCGVGVLDAVAEGLAPADCRQRIRGWRPDAVVFLASASSWRGDRAFLRETAEDTGARMPGCGEIFLGSLDGLFRDNPWLEAGIRDFTDPGIPGYLGSGAPCAGLVPRGALSPQGAPAASKGTDLGPLRYGVPCHELFPLGRYRYPYHRRRPFASLLTAYGCPFHCRFCNSGNLGFRVREMGDILRELEHIRSLGIRQLFVKDMSFGGNRKHGLEFCRLLSASGPAVDWNCYARLDSLDRSFLEAMKRAGCHLVQMGLETASPEVGRSMGKPLARDKAREVFRACRKLGIRTGAHFVLGLPGETEQGIRDTVDLARSLSPDYCSFNLFVPRHGSDLAGLVRPVGAARARGADPDPSETVPDGTFCGLDARSLHAWRGRAYRSFYLRPGYLLRQAFLPRTRVELAGILRDAWGLGRNLLRLARSGLAQE